MGKNVFVAKKKEPWYLKVLSFGLFILVISSFYFIAVYDVWKLLFLIIPVGLIIKKIFFPSEESKFLKLQALLPTSKVNAVAMGMVEVVGDLEQINPFISPYFNKECIGYFYRVEEESKPDSDGHTSYHTIHFEQKIGIFNIVDETGFAKVDGSELQFYKEPVAKSEGRKIRHSEGYLLKNDYMMIIGYASSDNGKTVIRKESKKAFIIAKPSHIDSHNTIVPVLNSLLVTLFIATLFIIFILLN